jgi:F-type H+-transporting ATPase subunit delta
MRYPVIARRYSRAFYKLSFAQDRVAEVLEDLAAFAKLFAGRVETREFLANPGVPSEAKEKLIEEMTAEDITADFVKFLIDKGRLPLLPAIYEDFLRTYRHDAGILAVEVASAAPLADDLRERLEAALARLTGKRVEIEAVVDEAVVGGLKLIVGDHVIDGTLASRLEDVRETMAGAAGGAAGPEEPSYEDKPRRD